MAHDIPQYFYHGTSTHYLPLISAEGLPASLAGFGQSQLSGVGLTTSITDAEGYARSTANLTNSQPVLLVVEVPTGYWVNLRGYHLPMDIYEQEAAKEGFDPENHSEFRKWFHQTFGNLDRFTHPFPLTQLLMKHHYDGAVLDSTIKRGGEPEYVYFHPQFVYVVDEITLE